MNRRTTRSVLGAAGLLLVASWFASASERLDTRCTSVDPPGPSDDSHRYEDLPKECGGGGSDDGLAERHFGKDVKEVGHSQQAMTKGGRSF